MGLPFGLKLTVKDSQKEKVKPGLYKAKLVDIIDGQSKFGNCLYLDFQLLEEKVNLKMVASPTLSSGGEKSQPSKLFQVVTILLGRKPEVNEDIELQEVINKECSVSVITTADGFSQIEKVLPPDQGSAL